ncbi:MAG: GGDEF domain-containing protein [Clostridia bacterium]
MFRRFTDALKKHMMKVSFQVALFSCVLIAASCIFIFVITRAAFMNVIESSYRAKTDIIFNMIESHLDPDVYNGFSSEWDIQTEAYNSMRNYLNMVKENYSVDNIFLAKLNESKVPVYIMDVEKSYEKFHIPNSEMTGGIAGEVVKAFTLHRPRKGAFYRTENGWEYINVYPIQGAKSNAEAVACIGINAQTLFNHTWLIMILVAVLIIFCVILAIVFSNKAFKKISNPFYQDASNTDSLTGLKNKNSFSVDFHNIENQGHQERYSIVMVDLNGLKTINDTRGHHIGDKYIQDSAAVLKESIFNRNHVVYRVGGDEFAIIMQDASYNDIDQLVLNIQENTKKANETGGSIKISMSVGYAMFEKSVDRNFSGTMQRADTMMYNVKREYYKKKLKEQQNEV